MPFRLIAFAGLSCRRVHLTGLTTPNMSKGTVSMWADVWERCREIVIFKAALASKTLRPTLCFACIGVMFFAIVAVDALATSMA